MIWLPPLLAVWFFAASAICGQRLTMMMDAMWANLTRLSLAALFLAILTSVFAEGLQLGNAALPWFVLSGAVGFGIGDIGLYLAFARLGARLTLLINLCLAPLFAAAGERLLLGTRIGGTEFIAMLVVLLGVGLSVRACAGRARGHGPGLWGCAQPLGGRVCVSRSGRPLCSGLPTL